MLRPLGSAQAKQSPECDNGCQVGCSTETLKRSYRIGAMRIDSLFALLLAMSSWSFAQNATVQPMDSAKAAPGNEACAGCHSEIYKSYSKTVMANASGPASDAVITGEFLHKPSGVRYRVFQEDANARGASGSKTRAHTNSEAHTDQAPLDQAPSNQASSNHAPSNQAHTVWMSYERASEKFSGQRELLYFIGSGRKGRSYLFSDDGFLFETPINWYSQEGRWNMAPAYTEANESPMNLPAVVDCLNCHTSGMRAPVRGTENKYVGQPFQHAGITCERCHGAGEGHLEKGGDAPIVNPAKLPPDRRDSICMECHFEGTVAVHQAGKPIYQFQPGDQLADYIHYFLLSGNDPLKPEAISQFEALSLSECKRKSGDRMWCGSCHDPHAEPTAAQKVAYYRGKCLSCHGDEFAAKHHADKPDCVACHMPPLPSKDVAHTEGTDHRIRQNPKAPPLPRLEVRGTPGAPLVSFPPGDASLATTRDFALAWESLAQRNVENGPPLAEHYLRNAAQELPDDAVLLSSLGFIDQKHEQNQDARELYERALKIDPLNNDAAADLGILEAKAGNLRRAAELWQGAFERAPYRSAIGLNLAMVFCVAGKRDVAQKYVLHVLEFNPDYGKGKLLLENMKEDPPKCTP